jgi:crossover junction endodeoxyribonuclease RuvC
MRVIGVDPGSLITGYGIVTKNCSQPEFVAGGIIRASGNLSQPKRIHLIHRHLEGIIQQYSPNVMVVESLFHAENSQSLMKLSQVRGAILLLGEMYSLDIYEYSPREIKKGVTGYGNADKKQMVFMMGKLLNIPDLKSPDQADALAAALYHCNMCSHLVAAV